MAAPRAADRPSAARTRVVLLAALALALGASLVLIAGDDARVLSGSPTGTHRSVAGGPQCDPGA